VPQHRASGRESRTRTAEVELRTTAGIARRYPAARAGHAAAPCQSGGGSGTGAMRSAVSARRRVLPYREKAEISSAMP